MIDKTKNYTFRGQPVEILATDLSGEYPVLVKTVSKQGFVDTESFTAKGYYISNEDDIPGATRLEEAKEKRKAWVAIAFSQYGAHSSGTGSSKSGAIETLKYRLQGTTIVPYACFEIEF